MNEGRLLTEFPCSKCPVWVTGIECGRGEPCPLYNRWYEHQAQDAKTASIKDAELAKKCTVAFNTGWDMVKAECHQRITMVEKTLEKLHLEAQEQWMDTLLQKDAECQERVERIFKWIDRLITQLISQGFVDSADEVWLRNRLEALKKEEK